MLMTIVAIYTLYVLVSIYTSIMQLGYVSDVKRKRAVLLSKVKFVTAGNYAIAKEKLSVVKAFVDYIVFIAWIGFGIAILEKNIVFVDEAVHNIVIVLGFIVINSVISLPFSYYEKFVLDKKFDFNKSTIGLWIKDTFISFIMTMLLGSLIIWGSIRQVMNP